MSRKQGTSIQNKFIKGLVTEATALSFPEDACTEVNNIVFDSTGRVTRRLGFDIEGNYTTNSSTVANGDAYSTFLWEAVAGDGNKSFLVTQEANVIRFFDTSSSTIVGTGEHATTLNLDTYIPASSTLDPADYACQYAYGNGDLFIVNPAIDPIYVRYSSSGNSFTTTEIVIQYRDFKGLNDGLEIDERPTSTLAALETSNPEHYYNILNQGWGATTELALTPKTVAADWDNSRTDLPSNADYRGLYREDAGNAFGNTRADANDPGNRPAPKGHYILDFGVASRQANLTADGYSFTITDDTSDVTSQRFASVAFFAGRIFYGGVSHSTLANNIYFTQIIEGVDQYGFCYQKNDPTDENIPDLLADDGGVIKIADIGSIKKIYNYQNALLVLASNGIWLISGSSGSIFKADDYQVKKLSSIGTNAPESLISIKGLPAWWGEDGIYTVQFDANYDSFTPISITTDSIDTLYQEIPVGNKKYVKGAYDDENQIAYWIYSNDSNLGSDTYTYDSVLCLDANTKAFYTWEIGAGPTVRSIFFLKPANRSTDGILKLLIHQNFNGSSATQGFAEYNNLNYLDWEDEGTSTDYDSYFVTGYKLDGETQKFFQPNYVFVFLETETNASCFMQGIFDYTTSSAEGKWSTRQQVYNENLTNRGINFRRLKVRGKGRALQLRFESESQKPFTIIGWSIFESVNSNL